MSRSLIISLHSTSERYSRLNKKIKKSIARGEFWRFTRRKRHHLLHKIENLKRRLSELRIQLRIAGAGVAAAILMSAGTASAQTPTTLGPFDFNPIKNPLPPPAFEKSIKPSLTFADFDGDGDLDAITGDDNRYIDYMRNVGTKESPAFTRSHSAVLYGSIQGPTTYIVNGVRTAFADIDDDGDLDMLAGVDELDYTSNPNHVQFFRNRGLEYDTPTFEGDFERFPFDGIATDGENWPFFTDIDGDGDQDLILAGLYTDKDRGETAWVQLFRNVKEGHEKGVDGTFIKVPSADNPLYLAAGSEAEVYPAFADIDGDGDVDMVYSRENAIVHYRRNDKGVFEDQSGEWKYNAQEPGASEGNPFENLGGYKNLGVTDYRQLSFADLDGDNDLDLIVASQVANRNSSESPYTYYENTGAGKYVINPRIVNFVSGFKAGSDANASFVDIDKDGDLDIIATGSSYTYQSECTEEGCSEGYNATIGITTFLNNGDNTFAYPSGINPFPFPGAEDLPEGGKLIIADLDGDGDIDLASPQWNYYGGQVIYFQNNNGTYKKLEGIENPFFFLQAESSQYVDIDLADFNGDGLLDLVVAEEGEDTRLYKNTGTDGTPKYELLPEWQGGLDNTPYESWQPKIVDLDNDGDYDIIVGKYTLMWYYENIGTKAEPKFILHEEESEWGDPENYAGNPFGKLYFNGGSPSPSMIDVDGDGDMDMLAGMSNTGTFTFVENQNPSPVVTPSHAQLVWKKDSPITLDDQITLTDPDNDAIQTITVTISPYEQGKEKLQLAGTHPNVSASFADETGVLTLTGSGTIANYQAALRSIQYVSTSNDDQRTARKGNNNSNGGARTFTKTVTIFSLDRDGTVSASNTTVFNITHANDNPVLSPGTGTATFASSPIAIAPAITATDNDDTTLSSATISFGSSYRSAEDRLTATATGSITINFNQTTGVLALTGTGTLAEYQQVLQSIRYNNALGSSGNGTPRTITLIVNDGESDSNIASVTLNLSVANTPPTITGTSAPFWSGGDIFINPNIVLADANDLNFVGATVSITTGFSAAQDILLYTNQGGISGTYNSTTGVLTLTGTATIANYQAALRTVRYNNSGATPTTDNRTITFAVSDGGTPVQATTVIVMNKPPSLSTENRGTIVAGNIAITFGDLFSDEDNNINLNSLVVTSKQNAEVIINSSGFVTINYGNQPQFAGFDEITVTICDGGGQCKTSTFMIEVGAQPNIYSGMSPNGDGINDYFMIEFAPKGTEVAIYNRWGDAIFETSNYDNNDPALRFEGRNKSGADVIPGSYFYKIRYSIRDEKFVKTGYLLLNR